MCFSNSPDLRNVLAENLRLAAIKATLTAPSLPLSIYLLMVLCRTALRATYIFGSLRGCDGLEAEIVFGVILFAHLASNLQLGVGATSSSVAVRAVCENPFAHCECLC